jgi:16S rRNA (cytosine967-C5)-methyltransferase
MQRSRLQSQLNAAAELWELIKNTAQPADRFLGNFFHQHRKKFGSRDRRILSEIIYSLFRNKLFLETWAEACGQKDSRFLVLMAAFMEGQITEEIFGEEITGFSKGGLKHLAKSLQEKLLPEEISGEQETIIRYSCPEWLYKKWHKQFGEEETKKLLESMQKRPPFVVRTNTLKISREKLISRLNTQGFQVSKTERTQTGVLFKERANLFDSNEFQEGFLEVQDEGSQEVCEMIEPKPGETVWDVCAGGGGKSLAIAAIMQNKGRIIATDIRHKKLDDLRKRAKRAGVTNIFPADLDRMDDIKSIKGGVDKIVVDAPCTGTGTLRRNPDAKWKLKPELFEKYQNDQVEIVEKALPYLKPGGRLFYITCSLESEENEGVMERVLKAHPELKQITYPRSRDGFFRVRPDKHGTDGFFLAIAEKTQ